MKMLKMSGYPITNIHDYNKYFNIYDVLRWHKEFMVFALSHFANLSKTFSYCAAMVYTIVEKRIPVFMCDCIYEKKRDVDFDVCNLEDFWNNPFDFCQSCFPSSELLNMSSEIAKQFDIKSDDIIYKKIMLISIAAFAFLDDKPIEFKIDLDRAKKDFLGKAENERKNFFELLFEDDMSDHIQTITLEPSSQAYTCLPFNGGEFTKIKTFKIAASKKINSLSNRIVKISVGEKQIVIPAGEHIYVNTINGRIAKVLEKSQSKKNHTLSNTGLEKDVLQFDNKNNSQCNFYGNEYISSFDFSISDNSIIYINNLKLGLNMCLSAVLLKQLSKYVDLTFVEVKIVNNQFYLLKSNGELLSNDVKCNGVKNVYSIESVIRRYQ